MENLNNEEKAMMFMMDFCREFDNLQCEFIDGKFRLFDEGKMVAETDSKNIYALFK